MKTKLIGSAATEAQLLKLITEFFCGEAIELRAVSPREYQVHNKRGHIAGCRVLKAKARYRFELLWGVA